MTNANTKLNLIALPILIFSAACSGSVEAPVDEAGPADETIEAAAPEARTMAMPGGQGDATISGHVRSFDGIEEAVQDVQVCSFANDTPFCDQTDEYGHYVLENVPEVEEVEVLFFKEGFVSGTQRVSTIHGGAAGDAVLVPVSALGDSEANLDQDGAIIVRVREIEGMTMAPAEGREIRLGDEDLAPTNAAGSTISVNQPAGPKVYHAAEMTGSDGCFFLNGSTFTQVTRVDVAEGSTSTLDVYCGAQ